MNKVILVGNLGRDPETKATAGGQTVVTFTIAMNDSWTDKSGARQERTEWASVVAFGKLADLCAQYLAKGRQVYVEGRLQTRTWEDKDGGKRSKTEIVASSVVFLGGGEKREAGTDYRVGADSEMGVQPAGLDDSDIPF